jgi:hypothetical protein
MIDTLMSAGFVCLLAGTVLWVYGSNLLRQHWTDRRLERRRQRRNAHPLWKAGQ